MKFLFHPKMTEENDIYNRIQKMCSKALMRLVGDTLISTHETREYMKKYYKASNRLEDIVG